VSAEPSIWKKEIKLRRSRPAAVEAVAHDEPRRGTLTPPPVSLAPTAVIEPRFRRIEVLERLLDEYADEFPDRAEERRKMLGRLAENAEDGILPADLDGVIHTLFYDLLRRGLKPSKQFWKRENHIPKKREQAAPKIAVVVPKQPASTTSIWRKEISLGRPRAKAAPEPSPAEAKTPWWKKEIGGSKTSKAPKPPKAPKAKAVVLAPVAGEVEHETAEAKTPWWKKEIGGSKTPKAPKAPRAKAVVLAPVPDEVEVAEAKTPWWKKEIGGSKTPKAPKEPKEKKPKREKAPKAAKAPKEAKERKAPKEASGLRREIHLPKPSLPRFSGFSLPSVRGKGEVTKIVGLRIGSSQIAAALVNNNGSAEVLQLARSPLARGVVAAGEVRDPDALAESLKRFFGKHRLPRRSVRLGIATNRIGVRVLEVPAMEDPKQLANAIRFRAQEVLPIPIAEAVLDHLVIGEAVAEEGGEQLQRVLLVFAHRDLIDGYMDACNRAGIKLHGIDFDAFALLRAFANVDEDGGERRAALIAVSIGHERTIFAVSDGKICDFARVLEWGGASLDTAIGRALELEPEDAEAVKQQLTLSGEAEIEGISEIHVEAARAAINQELQLLARELVSSLQFYQSRPGSLDIGEIILTGGGAQLGGIEAELGRQLGVPIRIGDPLQRVKLGKDVPHPASPSLTIAVGLGIEESE
jgi:type IV pilus assembly protein PilM